MPTLYASIGAPEVMIVLGVLVLLFGGSQVPKLARSLGSAKNEFEKGQRDTAERKSLERQAEEERKAGE